MPRPKNALSIEDAGNSYNPLSAADVWEWHKQNAADAWKAAQDPQTWRDAAQQYGQALLMGSIGPEGRSLRAFHGSPHDFGKFDLSKIGTGEGAQAYGHGMYFAGNEAVAREYRDALSKSGSGQIALDQAGGDVNAAIMDARRRIADYSNMPQSAQRDRMIDVVQQKLSQLQHFQENGQFNQGHMYEVGINADPEHFLHWDKPLSEQSQAVQSMADKVRAGGGLGAKRLGPDATGQDLYRAMNSPFAGKALGYENWSTSGPSEHLAQAGIPGIKYLDQGSRGAGEGTSNYVVFNPETIDILRKYGIAGLTGGGAAAAGSQQSDQ